MEQKYLIGAKPEKFLNSAVDCPEYERNFQFDTLQALIDSFEDESEKEIVKNQSQNKVKVCDSCHKSNGSTLVACNSCGTVLPEELQTTDNVMFSFVYGVKTLGGRSMQVSIRKETPKYLVYDDFLAISRCHVNAINTEYYIADIRDLFKSPEVGLTVIKDLYKAIKSVVKTQFYKNKEFMKKMFGNAKPDKKRNMKLGSGTLSFNEFLRRYSMAGFNCPPSQSWLHLQFNLVPLTPDNLRLSREKKHYTEQRFFPYHYIKDCLNKKLPMDFANGEEIIEFFKDNGVDYRHYYHREVAKIEIAEGELAPWEEEDFLGYYNPATNSVDFFEEVETEEENLVKRLQGETKMALQTYGRPYNKGKTSGGFYKYAKKTVLKKLP